MAGDVMMSGITVEQFPGTDPDRAGAMTAGRHFILHENGVPEYAASTGGAGALMSTGPSHVCTSSTPESDKKHFSYDNCEGLVPFAPADMRGPVRLPASDADQGRAAAFTAALWACITQVGGPRPDHGAHKVFPGAFTADWLCELELPTREHARDGQAVALAGDGFARHGDRTRLPADYQAAPRTWVFERADWSVPWLNLAASYLTKLSASRFPVNAAVYDSHAADQPSAVHRDQWYSAVVHIEGAKAWRIGADECRVTTRPGDVLLLPEGLVHAVSTPVDPGYSRHLVYNLAMHTVCAHAA